jgi:hypothetical protein
MIRSTRCIRLAAPARRPIRWFSIASLALTAVCALSAHAAITVTDDSGATVTLAAPAQRVISLAPHVTELLYAAGGGSKMVGAVSYSDYPPEAKQLPRVGDNKALDLERIVALKPDLIVVWRHGNAERQLERLRELHVPLFFSEPRRLDDVAVSLTKLGRLLGTSASADAAAATYRDDIAGLRARYANRPSVSVFYQVWDRPLMTATRSRRQRQPVRDRRRSDQSPRAAHRARRAAIVRGPRTRAFAQKADCTVTRTRPYDDAGHAFHRTSDHCKVSSLRCSQTIPVISSDHCRQRASGTSSTHDAIARITPACVTT